MQATCCLIALKEATPCHRYTNTIGDFAGCVTDIASGPEQVIAVKARFYQEESHWRTVLGSQIETRAERSTEGCSSSVSIGQLTTYVVAYANEESTIKAVFRRIKEARVGRSHPSLTSPIDETMRKGWKAYIELATTLLTEILPNAAVFGEHNRQYINVAMTNALRGPMSVACGCARGSAG